MQIHEIIDGQADKNIFTSKFAFRLVYNGEAITVAMKGCSLEYCDIKVLTDRVSTFATKDRNCDGKNTFLSAVGNGGSGESIFISFLILLAGALIGGLAVFVYVTGEMPKIMRKKRIRLEDANADREGNFSLTRYSDNPGSSGNYGDEEPGKDADGVPYLD